MARFHSHLVAGLDEPVRRYLIHALADGAPLAGVRLGMRGRIKAGAWLPFTAEEKCDARSFEWRARVGLGPVTLLRVVDRFADGMGSTAGRAFGRLGLFRDNCEDTARSAAGRAALEAVFAPGALLAQPGLSWHAEAGDHIVASWDVPPERPEIHLRIDGLGGLLSASAARWGKANGAYDYIPCGCEVRGERRFGDYVVPSSVTVGWWFGTPRYAPFFKADVLDLAPLPD
jgi:hypothetical protein